MAANCCGVAIGIAAANLEGGGWNVKKGNRHVLAPHEKVANLPALLCVKFVKTL